MNYHHDHLWPLLTPLALTAKPHRQADAAARHNWTLAAPADRLATFSRPDSYTLSGALHFASS